MDRELVCCSLKTGPAVAVDGQLKKVQMQLELTVEGSTLSRFRSLAAEQAAEKGPDARRASPED